MLVRLRQQRVEEVGPRGTVPVMSYLVCVQSGAMLERTSASSIVYRVDRISVLNMNPMSTKMKSTTYEYDWSSAIQV